MLWHANPLATTVFLHSDTHFFEFISRMQSKSTFFINLDPRSIKIPKKLKFRPHKTLLWAAKTQTRPLRLQRQLWFWRIHQSHRCFRAFARTLLQATLADLLVFIDCIELGRQKINKRFCNFSCSRPDPLQVCPLGVHMTPFDRLDSLVFIGFALRERIWSNLGLPWDLQGSLVCTSPWRFYRAMWPFGHENWLQRDLDTN